MSILEIPLTPDTPDFRQVASLDGAAYVLDVSFSDRTNSWYVSVLQQREDSEPTPIAEGVRLAVNYPVLAGIVFDGRPQGELIPIDLTNRGIDPSYEDLGTRVRLYYYDASEMARIVAEGVDG